MKDEGLRVKDISMLKKMAKEAKERKYFYFYDISNKGIKGSLMEGSELDGSKTTLSDPNFLSIFRKLFVSIFNNKTGLI